MPHHPPDKKPRDSAQNAGSRSPWLFDAATYRDTPKLMRAVVAVALCALLPSGARGWPVALGMRAPTRLAVDRDGEVLAAIPVRLPRFSSTYDIAKLEPTDGHIRWRHRLNGTGPEQSTDIGGLLLTHDADPLVAGTIVDPDGESIVVTRLASGSGLERWRTELRGTQTDGVYNNGLAAVVDAEGNPIVAGNLQNGPGPTRGDPYTFGDFAVAKLDSSNGSEQWRFILAGPLIPSGSSAYTAAEAEVVAVDGAGDVIAAGEVHGPDSSSGTLTVVKVAGATGALLWRNDLDIAWRSQAIVLDSAGDAFLAVSTVEQSGNDFGVVKIAGGTGQVLWVDRESGSQGRWQEAVRVLTDASGDVFASGMINDGAGSASDPDGYVFTVVRLDGMTGSRRWVYETSGTAGGGFASQLALAPSGLLIAGGSIAGKKTCADVRLVALDANTGAPVWSRGFDGTYVRKSGCAPDFEGGGPGAPLDDDNLGAMVTDARGRIFAGMALTNRTSTGVRDFGSIRRLRAPTGRR